MEKPRKKVVAIVASSGGSKKVVAVDEQAVDEALAEIRRVYDDAHTLQ